MRTRLTELLGIEHPVMLAGMGGVSYHRLVAAVSEAGGIGTLGASTMRPGELAGEIAAVRAATAKPFGVDLLTALAGQVEAGLDDVIAGGARLFVAGLGVPRDVVDVLHAAGVVVGSMCGKVRHAIDAVAGGCDFVVAQGTEAGGHTGTVATMALVPQVVDAVGDRVPVVAAGGLFDGRGLAASLCLGADGVWVGTRFIATPEARAVSGYKDTLVATGEDGTVVSRAYTGKPCRVVRNEWTHHFDEHPDELAPFPQQVFVSAHAGANHLGHPDGTDADPTPRVLSRRPGRRRDRLARAGSRPRAPHGRRGRSHAGSPRRTQRRPRPGRSMSTGTQRHRVIRRAGVGRRHRARARALHRHPQRVGRLRRRLGGQRSHGRAAVELVRDWCAARSDSPGSPSTSSASAGRTPLIVVDVPATDPAITERRCCSTATSTSSRR